MPVPSVSSPVLKLPTKRLTMLVRVLAGANPFLMDGSQPNVLYIDWPLLWVAKVPLRSRVIGFETTDHHMNQFTHVFDPLIVRFRRPLVRPLIQSTRLHSRCKRPHPRSCRFAIMIKTTYPTKERSRHAFGDLQKTAVRYTRPPVRYRYDLTDHSHDHVPDRGDRLNRHRLIAKRW